MADSPHDVTAQAVVEFTRILFQALAEQHGSTCTLNDLRVMNQMILCSLAGRTCSVTALHEVTGISKTSISRSITRFQSKHWISERRHPTDHRKRIISLEPRAFEKTRDDIDSLICWINNFRENGLDS